MPKILIIGSSDETARALRKLLSGALYSVAESSGNTVTLKQIREESPDLVITDLPLLQSGETLLPPEIIRFLRNSRTPMLSLVSSFKDTVLDKEFSESGAVDFMTLTADRDELLFRIEAVLKKRGISEKGILPGSTLRQSTLIYQSLFEHAADPIYVIHIKSHIISDCNPVSSEISGYALTELKTMTVEDLFPVQEQDVVSQILKKVMQEGTLSGISGLSQLTKDGQTVPVEINATRVEHEGETYCLAIIRDVTERMLYVKMLRDSEEKYRGLFRNMFIGCALHKIVLDKKGDPVNYIFCEVNEAFETLTGLKKSDIIGKKVTSVIPGIEADQFNWIGKYGEVALKGGTLKSEQFVKKLNRWYSVSAYRPAEGYFISMFEDITAKKQSEQALMAEKQYSDVTINSLPGIFYSFDEQGRFQRWNKNLETISGYSAKEIRKLHPTDFVDPSQKDLIISKIEEVLATGQASVEAIFVAKNGERFPFYFTGSRMEVNGRPSVVGMGIDLTTQKEVEERCLQAEKEWEITFDTIPDHIAVIDKDLRISRVNSALMNRLGKSREELIGRHCYTVIHSTKAPPAYCAHKKTLSDRKEHIREVYDDHLKSHFLVSASPILDSKNRLVGVVEVSRDITDLKKLEEKLHEESITDPLTGLFNRRGFLTLADKQFKMANRSKRILSLLYVDIDNMKSINDVFGHKAGDQALVDIAAILKMSFRESDILARIGGDEFAVLITGSSGSRIERIINRNISKHLQKYNSNPPHGFSLHVSTGIDHYFPGSLCTVDDIIERADKRMYDEKKRKLDSRITTELNERRAHERLSCSNNCWAVVGGSSRSAVKDISLGGICLKTLEKKIQGEVHEIRLFTHDGKEITASGKVIRSDMAQSKGKDRVYESAFAFALEKKEGKDSISSFMKKLSA